MIDADGVLEYCLGKPGAWRDEPWEDAPVVKAGSKIFCFLGWRTVIGVKCGATREEADEWLVRFPGDAVPMPYRRTSGWNSLALGAGIPDEDLLDAVDLSYELVVRSLPRRERPAGWDG